MRDKSTNRQIHKGSRDKSTNGQETNLPVEKRQIYKWWGDKSTNGQEKNPQMEKKHDCYFAFKLWSYIYLYKMLVNILKNRQTMALDKKGKQPT